MKYDNAAKAKPPSAIITVSLHFVLSSCKDQKSILYAQSIINNIAIIQASHIKASIA
jgi:hypothetical protein